MLMQLIAIILPGDKSADVQSNAFHLTNIYNTKCISPLNVGFGYNRFFSIFIITLNVRF